MCLIYLLNFFYKSKGYNSQVSSRMEQSVTQSMKSIRWLLRHLLVEDCTYLEPGGSVTGSQSRVRYLPFLLFT